MSPHVFRKHKLPGDVTTRRAPWFNSRQETKVWQTSSPRDDTIDSKNAHSDLYNKFRRLFSTREIFARAFYCRNFILLLKFPKLILSLSSEIYSLRYFRDFLLYASHTYICTHIHTTVKALTLSVRFLAGTVVSLGRAWRSVSLAIRLKRCIRSRTLSCSAEEGFVVVIASSSCNLSISILGFNAKFTNRSRDK